MPIMNVSDSNDSFLNMDSCLCLLLFVAVVVFAVVCGCCRVCCCFIRCCRGCCLCLLFVLLLINGYGMCK